MSKDVAFLVDSVAAAINERNYLIEFLIHPLMHVRYEKGALVEAVKSEGDSSQFTPQSHIHIHLQDVLSPVQIADLRVELLATIEDVIGANKDWKTMLSRLRDAQHDLSVAKAERPDHVVQEYADFLQYLYQDNFTLLGYAEYTFKQSKSKTSYEKVEGLGLLRNGACACKIDDADEGFPRNIQIAESLPPVIIAKTKALATVHRRVPMDSIAIKTYDENGNVTGERLFLGLFTSVTYSRSVNDIPYLRMKIQKVLNTTNFAKGSHDSKALRHILEKYPRDELFQTETQQLHSICVNILRLQERQRIALFTRGDVFNRYISCLVYVPRERFGTKLREKIVENLEQALGGTCSNFYSSMDDSVFARVMIRIETDSAPTFDERELEEQLQELGRSWSEKIALALEEEDFHEADVNRLTIKYGDAFPVNYTETYKAKSAVSDIHKIEAVMETQNLQLDLYRLDSLPDNRLRLKLYNAGEPIILSDVMPILGHLGLRAISELPFKITPANSDQSVWVHDFLLESEGAVKMDNAKVIFEGAFVQIWNKSTDSDNLNKLILTAQLPWRDVIILRCYMKYMRQVAAPYSQSFLQTTLTKHAGIAGLLVDLFYAQLDPAQQDGVEKAANAIVKKIETALQKVDSLNEDQAIRMLCDMVKATLRTNFFQAGADGAAHKEYLSIKLDSQAIDILPRPKPYREIFVYSTQVEAIHLRGDMIARGGLRWSDRLEDFRTEVLSLMKAQMVKNSVIVPMGSKGGFVVKTKTTTREEFKAAGIACYQTFIRGLLDITDNLDGDAVIPPADTVRRDGDDPYLVVAADKGTATFSDIANNLSQEYGFWLDDAFASGGSAGYDHKKMGITARGAWESVKLHFRELNRNTQAQNFDVIGVGDMGGDVFGNGMLLSEHICLIGAFNHLHIFCDPDPDPKTTYMERKRLFDDVSGWDAYDEKRLSKGGRIYSRADKALELTPEIQKRFDIAESKVTPNALIQAMLKARTDLLWFGGIGTYIKATTESDSDVGDKANDLLRIDAPDLRAKVIGEGANLGVTQLGRIEFAQNGGRLNSDFIDNSGGVDSSDHEVNIKILLSAVMQSKEHDMDLKARNKLLENMTKDIEDHVLRHNYQQAQAVSLTELNAAENLQIHDDFIQDMVQEEGLVRSIEFLPGAKEVQKRLALGKGLSRPELSVLISYAKIALTKDLLKTDIPDNPDMQPWLFDYFPDDLRETYAEQIKTHKLAREIIAMAIANSLINRLGPTFIKSTMKKTGMSSAAIVKAYMVVRDLFELRGVWNDIEAQDNKVPAQIQLQTMADIAKLIEHSIVWILRHYGGEIDIAKLIERYHTPMKMLREELSTVLGPEQKHQFDLKVQHLRQDGLPAKIATVSAALEHLVSALDICQLSEQDKGENLKRTAQFYFITGEHFKIDWLRRKASQRQTTDNWDKQATLGLIVKLYSCQSGIAIKALSDSETADDFDVWLKKHDDLYTSISQFFEKLANAGTLDLAMLILAEQRLRGVYEV